ncbi:uncharacterized protein LOC132285425 isoform X2 [Cornus florida]|uniref:uncharacterized protein LOC132285425 isoform X2 n=1 Tax=Cornus florida TaxID=4283 RepID=UPI0028A17F99|nr:uncharacterized protein LOC132285425 isoform X2 [Cornus florida]
MADRFHNQAKQYSETRPSYPDELFQFIGSKTPNHHLAWDVGTGNGQAATSLARMYKNVVATDTSQKQLDFAPKLPNVRWICTAPNMSMAELQRDVAAEASVDLITIAQALHWFDLPTFYQQARWVLKKPHGVIAAWCYTATDGDDSACNSSSAFDSVFQRFYSDSGPYWDPARKLVDDKYRSIDFPFEPIDGANHTGPFEFKTERLMDLDGYFRFIRSWSAYQIAQEKGVELLRDDVMEDFKRAWTEDGNNNQKLVKSSVYLRIGKVGNWK